MIVRYGPPYLVLAALIWATSAKGGTGALDLVLVGAAIVAADILGRKGDLRRRPQALLLAVAALEAWLLVDGIRTSTPDLETIRLPALVLIVGLTGVVARRFTAGQRTIVLDGLILIGAVQAIGAILGTVVDLSHGDAVSLPTRASSLIGNANALGALLVGCSIVTMRAMAVAVEWPLVVALLLQGVAILLTGSRLAIVMAIGVAVWAAARRGLRSRSVALSAWLVAAVAVLVARFRASGADRLGLWADAVEEIACRPLAGRGAEPVAYLVAGIAPTTHAHNEALQIAVEYGVIGLVLVLLTTVLAIRAAAAASDGRDGWLLAAAASLGASGLTDIGLRITAIVGIVAVLAAFALRPPVPETQRAAA